jgi:hypothetical protein
MPTHPGILVARLPGARTIFQDTTSSRHRDTTRDALLRPIDGPQERIGGGRRVTWSW